jgi:hypothetical protein
MFDLEMQNDENYKNVFGITYNEAFSIMQITENLVRKHNRKGFMSYEECVSFAKSINIHNLVYLQNSKSYGCMNHTGDLLLPSVWKKKYYNVMYYLDQIEKNGKVSEERVQWSPEDEYENFADAKCLGEIKSYGKEPIYYRDYFRPMGYFNELTRRFNRAMPFTTFARSTGRDTSHIHTLLRHIAGECYGYLLDWLRHKLLYPTKKAEVIPIFVSPVQGCGKSTFAEVICKGLFEKENVIVSYQYDTQSRFNSDQTEALIVALEEKSEEDKKNTMASLKSSATATQVRKENKGVDPVYIDSYTDYCMSTNEFVPLKLDGTTRQRRFMIMECDPTFTRATSPLAKEVFDKLYGLDENRNNVGTPFIEDKELIEQFKYELYQRDYENGNVNYRDFPETDAYKRCYTIPQTPERAEIVAIISALAPFLMCFLKGRVVSSENINFGTNENPDEMSIKDVIEDINAIQFVRGFNGQPDKLAVNRQLVFKDSYGKPLSHAVVEKTLLEMRNYLRNEYNLILLSDTTFPRNGFTGIKGKYRYSQTAWFILETKDKDSDENNKDTITDANSNSDLHGGNSNGHSNAAIQDSSISSEYNTVPSGVSQSGGAGLMEGNKQGDVNKGGDANDNQTMGGQEDGNTCRSELEINREERNLEERIARHSRTAECSINDNCAVKTQSTGDCAGVEHVKPSRCGSIVRYNRQRRPSPNGELETLNELKDGFGVEPWGRDRRKENVAHLDTFLLEADETTEAINVTEKKRLAVYERAGKTVLEAEKFYKERLEIQFKEATRLIKEGIAFRAVYSGSKSIHILVRALYPPENLEERYWLDGYLKKTLSQCLVFDKQAKDPARLVAAPYTFRRSSRCVHNDKIEILGTQKLLFENEDALYRFDWRPLYNAEREADIKSRLEAQEHFAKKYPDKKFGTKAYPARPEDKEAADAIIDGTFFTSSAFNGRRQNLFLTGYRRLRGLGHGHNEIWLHCKLGLQSYYRKDDVQEWLNMEASDVIRRIDDDYS